MAKRLVYRTQGDAENQYLSPTPEHAADIEENLKTWMSKGTVVAIETTKYGLTYVNFGLMAWARMSEPSSGGRVARIR